jgi:hypothetical protein
LDDKNQKPYPCLGIKVVSEAAYKGHRDWKGGILLSVLFTNLSCGRLFSVVRAYLVGVAGAHQDVTFRASQSRYPKLESSSRQERNRNTGSGERQRAKDKQGTLVVSNFTFRCVRRHEGTLLIVFMFHKGRSPTNGPHSIPLPSGDISCSAEYNFASPSANFCACKNRNKIWQPHPPLTFSGNINLVVFCLYGTH